MKDNTITLEQVLAGAFANGVIINNMLTIEDIKHIKKVFFPLETIKEKPVKQINKFLKKDNESISINEKYNLNQTLWYKSRITNLRIIFLNIAGDKVNTIYESFLEKECFNCLNESCNNKSQALNLSVTGKCINWENDEYIKKLIYKK